MTHRTTWGVALGLLLALALGCPKAEQPKRVVAPTLAEHPEADPAYLDGRWSEALVEGLPKPGGQLVVRLPTEPTTLNRLVTGDLWLSRIIRPAVNETLLRVDGDDQPAYPLKPCLATSYEASADHLTYTFKLRKGVHFHNGDAFTAKDVISTFNKLMDPKVRAQSLRALVEGLTSWKALDAETVQFTFKEPVFLALRNLATAIPIYPASALDPLKADDLNGNAPLNRAPVGTGPWRFEAWEAGQKISFVRNADYWDPARTPHLDRLVFRVVADATVAYQLMQRGELDVVSALNPDQWVEMGSDSHIASAYRRFRYFTNNYGFVAWNEKRPFFADKRVRLALAELFDQDGFNENLLHGLELRTACAFYGPSPACDPDLKPVRHDPEHARALLKQAGWEDHDGDGILDKDGVPFRFRFSFPQNNPKLGRMAAVLQDVYQQAGIALEIDKCEWAVLTKRLADHDFDAVSLLWGTADVEVDPYQVWHSSQAKSGSNYAGFVDPVADKLIEVGRREFDPEKRNALWRQLGKELYDQQPYLWLTSRPELEAVKRRCRGVKPSVAYYDFAEWWLEE